MTQKENARMTEESRMGAMLAAQDVVIWMARWTVHKVRDPYGSVEALCRAGAPLAGAARWDEIISRSGNLLMYGGVSCLWQCLIGNGTGTAGQALTFFNNGNAAIGVGDSNTAAAATQTNLQASTNKLRVAMDATYPQHSDATTSGAASIVFRSTFGTSQANWAWAEWGTFNSATDAVGRMLNRKVESLGTKTSAATWVFTVTLSIS